jgi:hypothetical protein
MYFEPIQNAFGTLQILRTVQSKIKAGTKLFRVMFPLLWSRRESNYAQWYEHKKTGNIC